MRDQFKGWYKPTDEEFDLLWDEGLIVLDANALLAPYRVRVETQRLLFNALEAFKEQLWCPHQAGLEYQRNRLGVIAQQLSEYDEIRKKLETSKRSLLSRRRDHPVLDADRLADLVQRSMAGIERFIATVQRQHPSVLGDDEDQDDVRSRWDELLSARVGPVLPIDDAWKRVAEERYAAEIPPGFEDRKKDKVARQYGDLIIWCEVLQKVEDLKAGGAATVPVMFVTDDGKRDWWRFFGGNRLGPDPLLTEEIASHGGEPFWIYSVSQFVEAAALRLGWDLAPEGTDELRSAAGGDVSADERRSEEADAVPDPEPPLADLTTEDAAGRAPDDEHDAG